MPEVTAVLGGDRREHHMARLLRRDGHDVRLFGAPPTSEEDVPRPESSLHDAVRGATWILCPSPGLSRGNRVYAPACEVEILLDEGLLRSSSVEQGGLVLGRATPEVSALVGRLGIPVHEMKGDRALTVSNAASVADALVRLVIEKTDRVLPEVSVTVLGYGATGQAAADSLTSLRCRVCVAARSDESLALAVRRGARVVPYDNRVDAFDSDVVINTVPDTAAVPPGAAESLRDASVIDIASPPGGMPHEELARAGIDVTWARALAGTRAPVSVAEYQYRFIAGLMSRDKSASRLS